MATAAPLRLVLMPFCRKTVASGRVVDFDGVYTQRQRGLQSARPGLQSPLGGHHQALPAYGDHATLLELAVLAQGESGAQDATASAQAAGRENWEPATTARNMGLVRARRAEDALLLAWADEIEQALLQRSTAA